MIPLQKTNEQLPMMEVPVCEERSEIRQTDRHMEDR